MSIFTHILSSKTHFMNFEKIIRSSLSLAVASCLFLTGCSFERKVQTDEAYELEHEYNDGDIYYEENTGRGISLNTENITEYLSSGEYYILHDGALYPTYFSSQYGFKPDPLSLGDASSKKRFLCFTSENFKNIPTLFEGDKLYYFSGDGVYDYSCVERYIPWGWTVGIRDMHSNTTGHVYVNVPSQEDAEEDKTTVPLYSPEFIDIYEHVDAENGGKVLIDKIGGINFTDELIRDGMVDGLTEGAAYDFEMYRGTNYFYYHASANIFMFQGFESYALWEYTPLQDYLYEVKIPDYLLNGYYNFDGKGLIRLVRGTYWNQDTDFSEKLLYSTYAPGEYSPEELAELEEAEAANMPRMYSENEKLNSFKAFDETCFGYVDEKEVATEETDASGGFKSELEAAYLEASTTVTPIWLPQGSSCTIAIVTTEKTGKVKLETDGDKRTVPYDRIYGGYKLEFTGKGEKANIIVQGLYSDYTIKLVGCEQYRNQDSAVSVEEGQTENAPSETPSEAEAPEETTGEE